MRSKPPARFGRGRRKRTQTTGTSPAAYLTLGGHTSAAMRALIASRAWLRVYQLPAYAPELNPAEGVWSSLKRGLGNLVPGTITDLNRLVKTRLKQMQYVPGLVDGFFAGTGLSHL